MLRSLENIMQDALQRVGEQVSAWAPPLIAAVVILAVAWVVARVVRWALMKFFKGAAVDRFLRESGIASMLGLGGRFRASRLVPNVVYWGIFVIGIMTAVNAFGTKLSGDIVATTTALLPRLLGGLLILIGGAWLAQYLGRTLLVWAANENLPAPRRWSALLRILITFMSVAIAADVVKFAPHVFFAGFLILAGGIVLALSLALGIGGGASVQDFLGETKQDRAKPEEHSIWQHL